MLTDVQLRSMADKMRVPLETVCFKDQLPLLSRKELRPALRTRAEVEANVESRDSFE